MVFLWKPLFPHISDTGVCCHALLTVEAFWFSVSEAWLEYRVMVKVSGSCSFGEWVSLCILDGLWTQDLLVWCPERIRAPPTVPCFLDTFLSGYPACACFIQICSFMLGAKFEKEKEFFFPTKYWSSFLSLPCPCLPAETSGCKWRAFCCRVRLFSARVEWISRITDCSVSILLLRFLYQPLCWTGWALAFLSSCSLFLYWGCLFVRCLLFSICLWHIHGSAYVMDTANHKRWHERWRQELQIQFSR